MTIRKLKQQENFEIGNTEGATKVEDDALTKERGIVEVKQAQQREGSTTTETREWAQKNEIRRYQTDENRSEDRPRAHSSTEEGTKPQTQQRTEVE